MFKYVVLCEIAMCSASIASQRVAAVFLDFVTACPSLVHRWQFRVQYRARVPERGLRYFRCSYQVQVTFVVGGEGVASAATWWGVKAGCPLSGPLFAIVVDHLPRRLVDGGGTDTTSAGMCRRVGHRLGHVDR